MLALIGIVALIWGGGHLMGASPKLRGGLLAGLYLALLLVHFVLPDGHPIRQNTGGSVVPWLILGGILAIGGAYALVLRRLKERARARTESPARNATFSGAELERYARHIVLRELGGPGQRALRDARVLVIGAGGLGAPALQYLAAAGVGTVGVIDDDVVENANLQRQVIHTDARIGLPKVASAQAAMLAQNPYVTVKPYRRRLDADAARTLFAEYDVILDGTDNFETRYLANAAAVRAGKPLISGALSQWEGQISVFAPALNAPCYQCIFPEAPAPGLAPSCAEAGVLGPLPGVLGAMMAVETVKLISGAGQPLLGEMLIYDALWGETRKIALKRRPGCPVCGG
ncbi:molybdopterin biosynthesis protein [Salipiger aestuarii]|uniref:Molybdopterin-synthase adenylyltransferase n=1 Tax=Salipiger aestuarii TaxID=568098 RepID=A0A327YG78_9RHOB|nr:molybdopterin-synthase adenylyltransferase MoeB [Salipiger aestuarii]KAA8608429.1 molybdopterin biosynthesis protein [Salipiger aestuarii]KAA8612293.1 molybdopterin biosynthesis protein [Salipiger aestuarii]KAB2541426.1 molybdopterin biosynthesis protein [Salipiger aestuarii]RAK20078.1 LPXTG-motif cell wall-anchored protein [Salipiger aestuarii]